jgi:arylsulfatase A-like enzyme
VVLILADDLGFRELGSYGQQKIRTPCLDRLAAEGIRLMQHYSGNAVCAPSRCVLMTGKHPGHAAIRNNSEVQPEGQKPLPAAEVTIAEALRARGYRTGAFGKWGLGAPGSEGDPLNQGFDVFFGYNCQRHAHSYYPDYLWSNSSRVRLNNDPPVPGHAALADGADPDDDASYAAFKGVDYAPDRIRDAAIQFLHDNRDQPFFLYFPSPLPHVALHVPDADLAPYLQLGWTETPFIGGRGGYTPHRTPRAAYAAMISRLDRDVGRLLDELATLGLADNTIVVFTSDNGTTHLQQEVDMKFFDSVGELRGAKGELYEGGIRVPCIVRWPGRIRPGTASDAVSGFEDWLPTLCAITGADLPDGIDGINLVEELAAPRHEGRPFLYREFPGYGGQQSLRKGRWKAIRTQLAKSLGPTQLFDLINDPGEQQNVAAQHPSVVAELESAMREAHVPNDVFKLPSVDP